MCPAAAVGGKAGTTGRGQVTITTGKRGCGQHSKQPSVHLGSMNAHPLLTAQHSMTMPLSATCRLFCRAAAFLLSCRSTIAYAASLMPICDGLRRVDRADSRRPSPAMPLLLGAYLQACNERQRWGQGGGGRGTKRHEAAALVHSLAAAEHRLGSHINLQGTGRLPHRVPRGCWVLPRQLLTAPQPPSPSRQPSRVAPPAAPQAPRRAWRRPRSRVGLRGGTGRLPIAGAKLTSSRGVTALRGRCSDVGIARRVRGRRDSELGRRFGSPHAHLPAAVLCWAGPLQRRL